LCPHQSVRCSSDAHRELISNRNKNESAEVITLSLTFDHRVVNGAGAAAFANEIKKQIEKIQNPVCKNARRIRRQALIFFSLRPTFCCARRCASESTALQFFARAMTTANKITIVRIVMIPAFRHNGDLLWRKRYARPATRMAAVRSIAIFILAAVSDGLDGYWHAITTSAANSESFSIPLLTKGCC